MGKALWLAFLERKIQGLLGKETPDEQRNIISAYIANLRPGCQKMPARWPAGL
jgi:hypothetical protein